MYNMEIHKAFENGPKKQKLYHHLKKEITQNSNISSEVGSGNFKMPKKGPKPKIQLNITLNYLYMTSEVKVDY